MYRKRVQHLARVLTAESVMLDMWCQPKDESSHQQVGLTVTHVPNGGNAGVFRVGRYCTRSRR